MKLKSRFSRGFTIVELLMVVAVIGILSGIVVTAASKVIRATYSRRANAMMQVLQSGLNAYYAQRDEWPGSKLKRIAEGDVALKSGETSAVTLTKDEANDTFRTLVEDSLNKKYGIAYVDPSSLFVVDESKQAASLAKGDKDTDNNNLKTGEGASGADFSACYRVSGSGRTEIKNMTFGYQNDKGKFRRFRITYYPKTDSVKVHKQNVDE